MSQRETTQTEEQTNLYELERKAREMRAHAFGAAVAEAWAGLGKLLRGGKATEAA